jgi:hypothetical protein
MDRLNPPSSDRDSLAALDALLKLNANEEHRYQQQQQQQHAALIESALASNPLFRFEALHHRQQQQRQSHNSLSTTGRDRSDSMDFLHHQIAAAGFSSPYSSSALHQRALSSLPPRLLSAAGIYLPSHHRQQQQEQQYQQQQQHRFSASQLAAAQAAALLVPPAEATASPSALSKQRQQHRSTVEKVAAYQKAAAAVLSSNSLARSEGSHAYLAGSPSNNSFLGTPTSTPVTNKRSRREDISSPSPTTTTDDNSTTGGGDLHTTLPPKIRHEKVEAALRSKPQRGKRRDDLSEKERTELTRTRNREHAKSTRYVDSWSMCLLDYYPSISV